MLPIDPHADIARRAWVPCPRCRDHDGCADCGAGRNCRDHWRYLLATTGGVLHVQCPACAHLWDHHTRFGAGGRPASL
ncbi:hypothetical protein [Sphaerisporangium sp. TRM90804]|uniref:hypothetical protein n=1 Tax=Sphaerisporangium sp. TRM90804 TaxID=3031113 RepID=UPI002449BB1C|nr:hypothetical protein [Sphaerisporangium sp. TRM90804]MDH2426255.1 hypothetical protein [Sphaerisporangium sp. TRM90804]